MASAKTSVVSFGCILLFCFRHKAVCLASFKHRMNALCAIVKSKHRRMDVGNTGNNTWSFRVWFVVYSVWTTKNAITWASASVKKQWRLMEEDYKPQRVPFHEQCFHHYSNPMGNLQDCTSIVGYHNATKCCTCFSTAVMPYATFHNGPLIITWMRAELLFHRIRKIVPEMGPWPTKHYSKNNIIVYKNW